MDAASGGLADITDLPTLAFDTYTTLLVVGALSPTGGEAPLTVTALSDDAILPGAAAVLRAVNAIPGAAALDFGLESAHGWEPLLVGVEFGHSSAHAGPDQGVTDANGYLPIAPLAAGQALSARLSSSDAATDFAASSSVEVDLGSIATILAIGGETGDTAHPPQLLLCMDNQPSGGLLSDCSVAPQ